MSHVLSTGGRHVCCQVGELLPFGDIGAPQYLPPGSVNINSKDFSSWLAERHDDRQAWADRRYNTVPYDEGRTFTQWNWKQGLPWRPCP
jgi:hypothetical protein